MSPDTIVIHTGSSNVMVGIAGESKPRFVEPTPAGVIEFGLITNIQAVANIWIDCIQRIKNDLNKNFGVILSMGLRNTNQYKLAADILFINCNIPFFYAGIDAIISLFATGRATGVVLDSGRDYTTVSSIINGRISNFVMMTGLGGELVTQVLQGQLYSEGIPLGRGDANKIKEEWSFFAPNGSGLVERELIRRSNIRYNTSSMCWLVPMADLCAAPEVLFEPKTGLDSQCVESIQECPPDAQSELFRNIILCGGTTLTKGFKGRLLGGIGNKMGDRMMAPIVAAPDNRRKLLMLGASLLTKTSYFDLRVTREEWGTNPQAIEQHLNKFLSRSFGSRVIAQGAVHARL